MSVIHVHRKGGRNVWAFETGDPDFPDRYIYRGRKRIYALFFNVPDLKDGCTKLIWVGLLVGKEGPASCAREGEAWITFEREIRASHIYFIGGTYYFGDPKS